jgi:hypothetical protein
MAVRCCEACGLPVWVDSDGIVRDSAGGPHVKNSGECFSTLKLRMGDWWAKSEASSKLRKDEEDERCMTGKFAPKSGVCVVCKGVVVGRVAYPHSDMIGGPPMRAYVSGWDCENCGLMYRRCPK